ncbi:MAG: SDR family oxidoreductase [Hyphomicrobiaceae bacterium]|nr:SDR family oxidoreductase [Hyphomicrobiaceae bacterium]
MSMLPQSQAALAGSPPVTRPFAVVTGGSEGIGLAIARELVGRGYNLLLIARHAERLDAAAASLRAGTATEIATLALDLTRPDTPAIIDARLEGLDGHVDLLVNNAGIGHCGAFADIRPDDLEALLALNVAVPLRLMRHVLPGMRARRRGGILNVASLGGFVPGPWQATYYASKAMLLSASEAVAAEVRGYGIRVTVVAPGPVATAFHARMGAARAYYLRLLPAASPQSVARWAVWGYELGLRVVAPGFLTVLGAVACRHLPHALLVPFMATLLHPRLPPEEGAARNA